MSHDRAFLDVVCTDVAHAHRGRLVAYKGDVRAFEVCPRRTRVRRASSEGRLPWRLARREGDRGRVRRRPLCLLFFFFFFLLWLSNCYDRAPQRPTAQAARKDAIARQKALRAEQERRREHMQAYIDEHAKTGENGPKAAAQRKSRMKKMDRLGYEAAAATSGHRYKVRCHDVARVRISSLDRSESLT